MAREFHWCWVRTWMRSHGQHISTAESELPIANGRIYRYGGSQGMRPTVTAVCHSASSVIYQHYSLMYQHFRRPLHVQSSCVLSTQLGHQTSDIPRGCVSPQRPGNERVHFLDFGHSNVHTL